LINQLILRRVIRRRQHNDQKKEDKRTNNDLQNITHITKDRATRTQQKIGGELRCSGRVDISCSSSDIRRATLQHIRQFLLYKSIKEIPMDKLYHYNTDIVQTDNHS